MIMDYNLYIFPPNFCKICNIFCNSISLPFKNLLTFSYSLHEHVPDILNSAFLSFDNREFTPVPTPLSADLSPPQMPYPHLPPPTYNPPTYLHQITHVNPPTPNHDHLSPPPTPHLPHPPTTPTYNPPTYPYLNLTKPFHLPSPTLPTPHLPHGGS